MPGKTVAPSLAESWTVSPDELVYAFVLHQGAVPAGEAVTADDVKFSFERYRGVAKTSRAGRRRRDARSRHVRFRLRQPWPDY
jgi:peptide/nickel transport system substrate-binding protein